MPWPKSSISLSIASVRPSILATPSPISRMTPTFCLAAAVLAPAICASISCSRSAIGPHLDASKTVLQRRQPGPHAAVIDIAAHLDAHPADQRRAARRTTVVSPGPYTARQTRPRRSPANPAASGTALSTVAVCRARSSLTSRRKCARMAEAAAASGRDDALAPPAGRGPHRAIRSPDTGGTVAWLRAWLVWSIFIGSRRSTASASGGFLGQAPLIFRASGSCR